jgi:hypothetical protein
VGSVAGKLLNAAPKIPTVEEIAFWNSEKTTEKIDARPNGGPIPYGKHETTLFKIGCKLRGIGMEEDQITAALEEICEKRCENPGADWRDMCKSKAHQACKYPPGTDGSLLVNRTGDTDSNGVPIPIVDDPSDIDPRFEMFDGKLDTKVYEDIAKRYTPYPDPGDIDLVSRLAKKLVSGTNIPLAYVREPLKAMVLHALDGKLIHPAYRKLSPRGNYFSLGESEGGKT